MKAETIAVRKLLRCGTVIRPDWAAHLDTYFRDLRDLESLVNGASPVELREGQWAILGLLARAYQLSVCCVEMLAAKNWNGFYAGARGLGEAVAAVAWTLQKPDRLPTLVRFGPVSVGKFLNAGYARHPDLKALYADMSLTVHPGRSGHLLGFHPPAKDRRGIMTSFSMDFSDHFFRTKMAILIVLTGWFRDDARKLVRSDGGRAITLGQVMVRVGKNGDA